MASAVLKEKIAAHRKECKSLTVGHCAPTEEECRAIVERRQESAAVEEAVFNNKCLSRFHPEYEYSVRYNTNRDSAGEVVAKNSDIECKQALLKSLKNLLEAAVTVSRTRRRMRCLTKTGAAPATEGHHVKRQKDPLLLTLPPFDSVSSGVHERLALMGGEGVSGGHVITNERVVPSQRVQRIPFAFKLHDYSRRPFPEFPLLLDDSIARETAALRAAPREEDHMAHLVTYTEPLNCVTETTEEPTTFSLAPVDCSPLFAQPQRFPFSDVAVSSLQVKDSEMAVHPRLCVDLGLSSVPEKLANLDEVDFMSEDSGDESAAPVEPVLMSQQFARLRGQSDKTPSEALHFDAFVDYFLPGK